MGKASRKKRQEESQVEFILKDKPSEAGETSAKKSLYHNPLFHIVLVTIIGLLAYSNTFNVPFHFDDASNIVENYKLRDLNNFWPPAGSRWFGFLTFALNYHFGGLNVTGYHIFNLIIHIFNAILVYYFVILSFKALLSTHHVIARGQSPRSNPIESNQSDIKIASPLARNDKYVALFSALIFVSHPIQTQAITYIVQRFTSLATFFYLLSLVMYIKWRLVTSQQSAISRQRKLHATRYTLYAVSLLSAILAMKTKEISFTLPIIITLYEFCFFKSQNYELRTMKVRRLLYLMPFLLTLLIIPLSMIGIDKPIGDAIGELREATQETEEISKWSYLFTQFRVIVTYIRLLFLPINQNLDYDYPIYHSFFDPDVFLSFLFLLSIFIFWVYLFYRSRVTVQGSQSQNSKLKTLRLKPEATSYTLHATRLISFGIVWFFVTLSVESSIIPIRDVINEHRLYLPSVGVAVAFTSAIFYFISRLTPYASRFLLTTVYLLLSTIIIALSGTTYARNIVWQDEVKLWADVTWKSPKKARGYNGLGNAYWAKGLTDKAIEHYQIALRLNPNDSEAHNNLGVAYNSKGLTDKAIEHYQIALKLNPDYVEAHYNVGLIYLEKGFIDKARREFEMALQIKPDYYQAQQFLNYISNLGTKHKSKNKLDFFEQK